ncbi:protein adenylyltransferase SelO family protein [Pendulispora albinea]|uniref:Protein nucleotidyltransferase YdiU n=1 Tax=Pendulispora albinea TaxID=2741071 RepID=A0ABZ2M7S9_9BACT
MSSYLPAPVVTNLGDGFYDPVLPARFPTHRLRFRNQRWAEHVGLGNLDDMAWEDHFAKFSPLIGNLESPLALRYHGHQFGVYNPALGDGRGFLFAQLRDDDGRLLDLGTKGSGQTPWSRGGDGRLTLKGGVREVLATEMLEALGVPTSKSFSLFETGEMLFRGDEPSPTRSSVLVRLSHSHVRFGSFQRHAHARDLPRLERLLEYAIEHYTPEARGASGLEARALAFVAAASRKSAHLAASFMAAGFVHGVLNTDNMVITGESFDYGPYRFLPTYDPSFVAAYFDETGMYAFGRQPTVMLWNVARLAEALRPLAPDGDFRAALQSFEDTFHSAMQSRFLARLGLASRGVDEDARLVDAIFGFLDLAKGLGYERFFFDWYGGMTREGHALAGQAKAHYAGGAFDNFRSAIAHYAAKRPEALDHPYFAGDAPCTLLIDEIESIWSAIDERDDWAPFESKIAAIRTMGAAIEASVPIISI